VKVTGGIETTFLSARAKGNEIWYRPSARLFQHGVRRGSTNHTRRFGVPDTMDKRRPVQPHIDVGRPATDEGERGVDLFRDAFARWAATVTIVAARDEDGGVHATTVSSFTPVSARPPLVAVCLGSGAQVLPWAQPESRIGVSLLGEDQAKWASIFTDSFPVGRPSWTGGVTPLLPGAVASFACTVHAVHPTEGGSRVLVCRVDDIELGERDRPLLYWQRGYCKLEIE
jgi:flavin reductase (DIM6/NTAB) family NADH-FMN oxidoreductase RutF